MKPVKNDAESFLEKRRVRPMVARISQVYVGGKKKKMAAVG